MACRFVGMIRQMNLKRRIDATNRRINRLAYDLYGLTEKEIRSTHNN